MTTIYLIRHGETDWNNLGKLQGRTDIPLNKVGRGQAKLCGEFFTKLHIDAIISSPLSRARETANIINEQLQLPIKIMENFIERSFGVAEGMGYAERVEKYKDIDPSNQEEINIFHHRVFSGIEEIQQNFPGKRVITISHGAVINGILSIISNGKIGGSKTP